MENNYDVVIVGAGLAGLACAKTLQENNLSFVIVESEDRPGGRIKTDSIDGFRLDHGFQVLQTAYPEVSRMLDSDALHLRKFPAGVAVRRNGKYHIIADPRHHPRYLFSTLASPIGTLKDRFAMAKLTRFVCHGSFEKLFEQPEETTIEFLRNWGFTTGFINNFFVPFFAGTCLDRNINASSRVLKYIFRMFAQGDAALPAQGMGEIPGNLASSLPPESIHYRSKVINFDDGSISLEDGRIFYGREIVLATSRPALADLLPTISAHKSMGESCLYYSADWQPPFKEPFLVLNGDGRGPINNMAFPSLVAPEYSSSGKTLIAVVVIGEDYMRDGKLEQSVREQCTEWFGKEAAEWNHLYTFNIDHALPIQDPPTANPYSCPAPIKNGVRICGEYQSLPGIQWALLSGRQTAEAIIYSSRTDPI